MLLLVDGNSIANRAFFTSKNYFFSMVDFVIRAGSHWGGTEAAIFVFDDPYEKSFRYDIYPEYKGNRKPDHKRDKFIQDLMATGLRAGACIVMSPEADDAIYTLSKNHEFNHAVIFSGDKDMFALIDKRTSLVGFEKIDGEFTKVVYNLEAVRGKYGTSPQEVASFKALAGDTSDNIPGVPRIGEVAARKLLAQYPSLDEIYANLDKLSPKLRARLQEHRQQAYMCYDLALMREVPVAVNWKRAYASVTLDIRSEWVNLVMRQGE